MGKTGGGERRRAQRVAVDALIGLAQALRLACEGGGQRVQVMREGGGLRLHAVGVGGDDGFGMLRRELERFVARDDQRVDFLQQAVAQIHARDGGGDVLTAASTV